ncbi:MAG: ferredoxin family protein [Deltaproteobacteria bacterium]|nr:ferredoxin family protein [Deltaproteobacteria bacterium]
MYGQKFQGVNNILPERNASKKKVRIEINREWCKGCGICVAFCPQDVFGLDEEEKAVALRPEECNGCGMCERRCPDIAIELK